jgi:hypothetical protein
MNTNNNWSEVLQELNLPVEVMLRNINNPKEREDAVRKLNNSTETSTAVKKCDGDEDHHRAAEEGDQEQQSTTTKTIPRLTDLDQQQHQQSTSFTTTTQKHQHPICQVIGDTSAQSLWNQHLDTILHASKFALDTSFVKKDLYATLLAWITPRLPLSVKSLPRNDGWNARIIPKIMEKAWARYEYLKQQQNKTGNRKARSQPEIPPPVTVLILVSIHLVLIPFVVTI